MENKPGLLVVMAHPDDESMGCGGLILRHTRAGIPVHLICATRGEKGWSGKPLGARREDLAQIRTHELEEAAATLALGDVELWDYPDGGVDRVDRQEITQRIWEQITRLRPKAVVGWGPDGAYGHPDHIALGAWTDTAVTSLAEGARRGGERLGVVLDGGCEGGVMKLGGIDCHRSQLEGWRILIRDHPRLMQEGYGHEPYIAIASRTPTPGANGLLGEFAG